jgi:hypothetical protein
VICSATCSTNRRACRCCARAIRGTTPGSSSTSSANWPRLRSGC